MEYKRMNHSTIARDPASIKTTENGQVEHDTIDLNDLRSIIIESTKSTFTKQKQLLLCDICDTLSNTNLDFTDERDYRKFVIYLKFQKNAVGKGYDECISKSIAGIIEKWWCILDTTVKRTLCEIVTLLIEKDKNKANRYISFADIVFAEISSEYFNYHYIDLVFVTFIQNPQEYFEHLVALLNILKSISWKHSHRYAYIDILSVRVISSIIDSDALTEETKNSFFSYAMSVAKALDPNQYMKDYINSLCLLWIKTLEWDERGACFFEDIFKIIDPLASSDDVPDCIFLLVREIFQHEYESCKDYIIHLLTRIIEVHPRSNFNGLKANVYLLSFSYDSFIQIYPTEEEFNDICIKMFDFIELLSPEEVLPFVKSFVQIVSSIEIFCSILEIFKDFVSDTLMNDSLTSSNQEAIELILKEIQPIMQTYYEYSDDDD